MMKQIRVKLAFILLTILLVPSLAAQDNACSGLILAALEATKTACQSTGRNQACYGNLQMDADLREGFEDIVFEKAGDIADVSAIQTLRLVAFSDVSDRWGVALLKLQANLPNSTVGDVSVLLFGDVQIANEVAPSTTLDMTVTRGSNVRLRPSAEGQLIGSFPAGQTVLATGRYTNRAGEEWVRVDFGTPVQVGWVFAPNLATEGDVTTLSVVEPSQPKLGPMQAFTFQSGKDDSPCAQAPESGILIQTPEGAGEVTLLVNEVNIQIGSTVFLQSQPGQTLEINNVEGNVIAEEQSVPEGAVVTVPMDENNDPAGDPSDPTAYEIEAISDLPISNLPQEIEISEVFVETIPVEETSEAEVTDNPIEDSPTPSSNTSNGGQRVSAVDSLGLGCAAVYGSAGGGEAITCITPGTQGILLSTSGDFYRVRFDNGVTGWVINSDVVLQ